MEKESENLSNLLSTYEEANRNLNNHAELLTGKFRNKGKNVWNCIKEKGQKNKKIINIEGESAKGFMVCKVRFSV